MHDSAVPPSLHIQGSSNAPEELDTLTIECNVTANPPANITWIIRTTNGNKNVLATSKRSISHHNEPSGSNGPILWSTLIVRDVLETDSGQYVCEAASEVFERAISVDFSVSVAGKFALIILWIYQLMLSAT